MADKLKGRLARIRSFGLLPASELDARPGAATLRGHPPIRRAARDRERPSFLGGWEAAGEMAWTRTLSLRDCLPASIDPAVFAPLRRGRAGPGPAPGPASEKAGRIPAERLRLFDLETTGLSGGTGTIAFLAAVGRLVDGEFALTQVFLEDYPGERAFLAAFLPLLEGGAIVTYNGKAFDLPLLRTRCVMNGLPAPEPRIHVDALFASRRLWRRVHGGASLGLLEREVLGIERLEDLPGAMIPEAWLAFARRGDSPVMRLVLSHNADDVVGLAGLLARAQAVFDEPRSRLARADVDRAGLGRGLLSAGRDGEGEELLEAAAGDGDGRAALILATRYRRAGRAEDYLRVADLMPRTYRCAVERAKACERLLGDLGAAARWAGEARRLASREPEREAAETRLGRIEARMSRGGPG